LPTPFLVAKLCFPVPQFLHSASDLIRRVFFLARPYGRKKLAFVFFLAFLQGIFQVIGVTSIFPFLALASDPERIRHSQFGLRFLALLPAMGNRELLIIAGIIAIAALLLSNAANLLAGYTRTRYAHGFGHWLRVRLLRRIASQPYGYFLHRNSGDLLKKVMGDVMNYINGVLLPLLDGVACALTAALLLITLFVVQPVIALVTAGALGAFYAIVFGVLARKRREANAGFRTAWRGSFREAQQMLGGIKPIKVHGAKEHFLTRFAGHSVIVAKMSARVPIITNSARYFVEPLAFGGLVLAVVILSARGHDLSDILPNLGVMAVAGYRLLPNLQLLYAQASQIASTRYSLDEVFEEFVAAERDERSVSARTPAEKPRPIEWRSAITLDEVSFVYPYADRPVLDRFSATIQKNESIGFIGPTGSGKSTLIDLLLGLHEPTSGRVIIDGQPLTPELIPSWQATIGYVPQEIFLIDDTVARNIALGVSDRDVDYKRLQEVCAMAQILDFIETELRDGFQTTVGERGIRLSGGQRQRLGLARALYHRPSLLLLDEATSALDTATEAKLIEALRNLSGKLTIVTVAHRRSSLTACERLIKLDYKTSAVVEVAD
jgi:ABC-type multidrug transport system fused ATPase/permease subunit